MPTDRRAWLGFSRVQSPVVLMRLVMSSKTLVFMKKKGGSTMERDDERDERTQVQHYLSAV